MSLNTHDYISEEKVRQGLQQIYRSDPESNLYTALLESFSDDLGPIDARDRRRPRAFLVLSFLVLSALVAVFVYFSVGELR